MCVCVCVSGRCFALAVFADVFADVAAAVADVAVVAVVAAVITAPAVVMCIGPPGGVWGQHVVLEGMSRPH